MAPPRGADSLHPLVTASFGQATAGTQRAAIRGPDRLRVPVRAAVRAHGRHCRYVSFGIRTTEGGNYVSHDGFGRILGHFAVKWNVMFASLQLIGKVQADHVHDGHINAEVFGRIRTGEQSKQRYHLELYNASLQCQRIRLVFK